MRPPKFTMNAFLLVLVLASALYLFVSVTIYGASGFFARNETYPVEGTGLYVRYYMQNTHDESGIYDGQEGWANLLVPGRFGYDWGAAAEGNSLYINEYHTTEFGFMTCDLVRIDLTSHDRKVLLKDTILIGRNASGEMVCLEGTVLDNWFPKTNPYYKVYAAAKGRIRAETGSVIVRLIDPSDGKTVWEARDAQALTGERQQYYLSSSLEEVMR